MLHVSLRSQSLPQPSLFPFLLVFMFTSIFNSLFICMHRSSSYYINLIHSSSTVMYEDVWSLQGQHNCHRRCHLIRNEITAQTAITVATHAFLTGQGRRYNDFGNRRGSQHQPEVSHLVRLTLGSSTLQHATMMMLRILCGTRTCTSSSTFSRAFRPKNYPGGHFFVWKEQTMYIRYPHYALCLPQILLADLSSALYAPCSNLERHVNVTCFPNLCA